MDLQFCIYSTPEYFINVFSKIHRCVVGSSSNDPGAISDAEVLLYQMQRCCYIRCRGAAISDAEVVLYQMQRCCYIRCRGAAISDAEVVLYQMQRCCYIRCRGGAISDAEVLLYQMQRCCYIRCRGAAISDAEVLLLLSWCCTSDFQSVLKLHPLHEVDQTHAPVQ